MILQKTHQMRLLTSMMLKNLLFKSWKQYFGILKPNIVYAKGGPLFPIAHALRSVAAPQNNWTLQIFQHQHFFTPKMLPAREYPFVLNTTVIEEFICIT